MVGERIVKSVDFDRTPDPGEIEAVAGGDLKPDKLFKKAHEALVPVSVEDLSPLGPIRARVWDLPTSVFARELSVEEWRVDDELHFVELSFKVDRSEAPAAERDWHKWLDGHGIGRDGDPRPKTSRCSSASRPGSSDVRTRGSGGARPSRARPARCCRRRGAGPSRASATASYRLRTP